MTKIVHILKQLFRLIMPFLRPYIGSPPPPDTDLYMEEQPEDQDPLGIFNPQAFIEAARYLSQNLPAYFRSHHFWKWGTFQGENYNSFCLYQKDGKFLKVLRRSQVIGWKHVGTIQLQKNAYMKHAAGKGLTTWCNMFIGAFTYHYLQSVGNPESQRNLQYWKKKGYDANQLIENLRTGFYNTKNARFREFRPGDYDHKGAHIEAAIAYAEQGGLVVVSLHLPGDIGHVAVLTGRYLDDEVEIANAGFHTGLSMTLSKGFGEDKIPHLQYWQLIKNENPEVT